MRNIANFADIIVEEYIDGTDLSVSYVE
jgi:hypothetical protein